jgi:hypothetical protein
MIALEWPVWVFSMPFLITISLQSNTSILPHFPSYFLFFFNHFILENISPLLSPCHREMDSILWRIDLKLKEVSKQHRKLVSHLRSRGIQLASFTPEDDGDLLLVFQLTTSVPF